MKSLTIIFLLVFSVPALRAQDKDAQSPSLQFANEYSQFIRQFRTLKGEDARRALIRRTSDKLNNLLKDNLANNKTPDLLRQMKSVRLLDLQPSFVKAIDDHPTAKVRALALLTFAEYSGLNERHQTCLATLKFLKQQYGKLQYQQSSYAVAADEATYFFTHLANGCKAPPTVGQDVDGAPFQLSDYKGKVVMLRFWGDWCPACRAMYGYERAVVGRYRNQPFALIGVNSDSRDRCREAQVRSNLMWRTVWDGGDTQGPVSTVFRVNQWPTIIVIDATGVIRFRSTGLDREKLNRILDILIKEAIQQQDSVAAH